MIIKFIIKNLWIAKTGGDGMNPKNKLNINTKQTKPN